MPFSGSNIPIPCPTPAIATPSMGTVTVSHSRTPKTQNKAAQSRQRQLQNPPKTEQLFHPARLFLKDWQTKRFPKYPNKPTWWTFSQTETHRSSRREASRCFTITTRIMNVERFDYPTASSTTRFYVKLAGKSYRIQFSQSCRQKKATTLNQEVR